MCSFRGSYANRGNGTELSSSDVVHRANRSVERKGLIYCHISVRMQVTKKNEGFGGICYA